MAAQKLTPAQQQALSARISATTGGTGMGSRNTPPQVPATQTPKVTVTPKPKPAAAPAPAPAPAAAPPPPAPAPAPAPSPLIYQQPSPYNEPYNPSAYYDAMLAAQQQAQVANLEAQKQSAYQIITDVLANYGLSDLAPFVNDMVFKEDIVSGDVILGRIRQTREYKQRFAANEQRRTKGLNVLSEGEYVSMERVYMQYLRASGLPPEMYDQNTDVQTLLANDVSVAELAARVNQGYEAVRNADPQVVQEMKRLYGVSDSQLAAYFLDPERAAPVLLKQAQSAQIAAEAKLQAGMDIGQIQAEQLATAGVTSQQAREGFQAIQATQDLFAATPFQEAITPEEQVAGVFGTSAAAQQRIRQRQQARQAEFAAGGRFAGQGSTFTGLQ